MPPKVLLIICAYNEAPNIVRVVHNLIERYPQYDHVVVNDGSEDETAALCRAHGYNLVDCPVNLGLTGAFLAGMRYAARRGYDYAVQFDGDDQHNAAYIGDMLDMAERRGADIVIGSRYVAAPKPWNPRMIGSRLIAGCILLTTGRTIADPTSGMRLYNKKLIRHFTGNAQYAPEPDTLAFFIRRGIRVEECRVRMNERIEGESCFTLMNGLHYTATVCLSILLAQWLKPGI